MAAIPAVAFVIDVQSPAPLVRFEDVLSIVRTIRAARDKAAIDATARLVTTAPGGTRLVLNLRLRARTFGSVYKTLIEAHGLPSHEGRILLIHDGSTLHIDSWHSDTGGPSGAPEGPTADVRLRWLSPCIVADDLVESHFWWTSQVLERQERLKDRPTYVVTSRAGPSEASSYRQVTSWIDTERMVPLRAEKTTRADGTVTLVTYDKVRQRDRMWMPGRIEIEPAGSGCRVELAMLGGTTRATLAPSIFDPVRLAPLPR